MVTITFFCVSPVTARVAAETISAVVKLTSRVRASRRLFMSVLRVIGSTSCPVRQGSAARVPGPGGSVLEAKGDREPTGALDLLARHAQRAERLESAAQLVPAVGGDEHDQHGGVAVQGLGHDTACRLGYQLTHLRLGRRAITDGEASLETGRGRDDAL